MGKIDLDPANRQVLIIQYLLITVLLLSGCQTTKNKGQDDVDGIKAQNNYKLGMVQMHQHNYDAAILSFESAIKQDDKFDEAYSALGWAYFAVFRMKEAKDQWEKSIALNPKSKDAYLGLGYLDFMDENFDSAISAFKAAIAAAPDYSAAHQAIGRVYKKQGLIDKAIAELEQSIKLNPNEAMSYWVLSTIYEVEGSSQKAAEYKSKALSIFKAQKEGSGDSLQSPLKDIIKGK